MRARVTRLICNNAEAFPTPQADLVVGGPKDEKVDVDFVVWLIRGGGRNILFDSGFHRERWFKQWTITDMCSLQIMSISTVI
jgi:hypothetical protein